MKLYIAVLDEFPDYMTPTLVAHSILGAHLKFSVLGFVSLDKYEQPFRYPEYMRWLKYSFKKCVVRVNQREFDKIAALPDTYLGHENNTLEGRKACAIPLPVESDKIPNVLKFAKLWKPL
jgi:hypothetical protein